jgi:hypothetical protein
MAGKLACQYGRIFVREQRHLIRRRIAFDRSEHAIDDVVSGLAGPGFS